MLLLYVTERNFNTSDNPCVASVIVFLNLFDELDVSKIPLESIKALALEEVVLFFGELAPPPVLISPLFLMCTNVTPEALSVLKTWVVDES